MSVKVYINWNIAGKGVSLDRSIEIIEPIWSELIPGYSQLKWAQQMERRKVDVDDAGLISFFTSKIREKLRPNESIREFVIQVISDEDFKKKRFEYDWYIVYGFADDASRAEITHHTNSEVICPECQNKYQDTFFLPAIKPEVLPASPKLMTFYSQVKLFCRKPFIEMYQKAGLTGLSFEDWEISDRHKVPLYLVRVRQHQWQDKTGVCEKCGMKTNITMRAGLFNVHEQFQYDIQHIRSWQSDSYVISRKAVEFFSRVCGAMESAFKLRLIFPIIPGYKEDIVWPEPKLFSHGNSPLYMLRSSWEKKG